MKRFLGLFILSGILLLNGCDDDNPSANEASGESGYNWVLVDIVNHERESYSSTEEGFEFDYSFAYAPQDYSGDWVYTGSAKAIQEIVEGESWGANALFSKPPEAISPGEAVTLTLDLTETSSNLSGWSGVALADAYFFEPVDASFTSSRSEDIYFKNETGQYQFILNTDEGILVLNENITAIAPQGKKGQQVAIRLRFVMNALSIGTDYIYEYKKN
ncbi:MAG: hypothetical protein CVV00_00170 [Firmicutes bacterium HGW-Firmicutes-5]|nr:MAG: hypothetical protein CVV00_00170 [Firmicutes bacterium HGW-Firmicutes-5]